MEKTHYIRRFGGSYRNSTGDDPFPDALTQEKMNAVMYAAGRGSAEQLARMLKEEEGVNKPKVSFTLQSQQEKTELGEYAKARGFANIGALARFALFQYVNRYPIKKGAGRTASER